MICTWPPATVGSFLVNPTVLLCTSDSVYITCDLNLVSLHSITRSYIFILSYLNTSLFNVPQELFKNQLESLRARIAATNDYTNLMQQRVNTQWDTINTGTTSTGGSRSAGSGSAGVSGGNGDFGGEWCVCCL